MLESLAQGDLISIGESHALGLERQYIADLYSDLAPLVNPLPVECMVETGQTSNGPVPLLDMNGSADPVRPQWMKLCGTGHEFDNPVNDYTSMLATYTPKGRVMTHTGMRHMLPFGLLYALDFLDPQWVDTPPTGTINRQLPTAFYKNGRQVRSHAVLGVDDLFFPELESQLQAGLKKGISADQLAKNEQAEAALIFSSPSLQFAPGEQAHVFEVHRVALSFPNQVGYISLLNHTQFSASLLSTLLAAPEMVQLLGEVDPATLQAGIFEPDSPNSSYGAAGVNITEAGTMYIYGNVKGSTAANPQSVLVMISPTKPVSLVHANQ